MIIKTYTNNDTTKTYGDVESVDCTIKTDDAKLFHILSNLYSRPLNAVVRELSTNCLDGHRVVGKEKTPFEIHINDNVLEDEFNIAFRDFGPGMSKETIVKVFSSFGESTKINSNLETGCLGLGSKSPFAVTSTFMVISFIDNIRYVYNMSKDQSGRPKITLFNESYTEEPNGMCMIVPLDRTQYDKSMILNAIELELNFFKVFPIIKYNDSEMRLNGRNEKTYKKVAHNCYMLFGNGKKNVKENYVIQAEIGYVLDIDKLLKTCFIDESLGFLEMVDGKLSSDTKSTISKIFHAQFFHIYMPNGTVGFAPSREELMYDKETSSNIMQKVMTICKVVLNKYAKFLDSLNALELYMVHSTNSDVRYDVAREKDTIMFGISSQVSKFSTFKSIVLNHKDYFGIVNTDDEKIMMGKHNYSYIKKHPSNPEVFAALKLDGGFSTYDVSDFHVDAIYNDEKFNHTKYSKITHSYSEISQLRNKSMKNMTYVPLINLNKALYCFVNIETEKMPSFKVKMKEYLASRPDFVEIHVIRYNSGLRLRHWFKKYINLYGLDRSDLVEVSADTINEYYAATNKVEKLKTIVINEKGETIRVQKDEISYYSVGTFKTFSQFKKQYSNVSLFSSATNRRHIRKFGDDEEDDAKFIKNTVYIPLDNKQKSNAYVENTFRQIMSFESLFGPRNENNIELTGREMYTYLDALSLLRFNTRNYQFERNVEFVTPLHNMRVICMNSDKAAKLGIKPFSYVYEKHVAMLKDLKNLKKEYYVFSSTGDHTRSYNIMTAVKYLKLLDNVAPIDYLKLSHRYNKKFNKSQMTLTEKVIAEKFGNIRDNFVKGSVTNEFFEFLTNTVPEDDKELVILNDNNISAETLVRTVNYLCPEVKFYKLSFANAGIFSSEVGNLNDIGEYIREGFNDDYRLKDSAYTLNNYVAKLDRYLCGINESLFNKFHKKRDSFIIVEEKKVEKKTEADEDLASA